MQKKLSFELFVAVWNTLQNLQTPHLHRRMAAWLARQARAHRKRLLLMAFRGSGKSTLVGLYAAWLLCHDPNLRILVISADEELAENMVRHVRSILMAHPLAKNLLPERRAQWAADSLTVKRSLVSRDPSLRAAGLYSNVTGARADIIICDDVEVPKTCDSAWKREQLRKALNELDFILTPNGMILYIGTPHAEDSLYGTEGYLKTYRRLELPLDGTVWPERFTAETIDALQRAVGPTVFKSQMLLQPVNMKEARLDPAKLRFYDGELAPEKSLSWHCTWDPAFGHRHGDSSVLACVAFDKDKNAYVHDLLYLKVSGDNAAAAQCTQVIEFLRQHRLTRITIEGNGLGQFLPGLLRDHLREANYSCAVHVAHTTKPKTQRILQAFDARLAAQALLVHERVRQTPFVQEMQDWQPDQPHARDDGLDAVAAALAQEPRHVRRHTQQFYLQEDSYE